MENDVREEIFFEKEHPILKNRLLFFINYGIILYISNFFSGVTLMEQKRTLSPYLECGKIINTHGVRGDVKLESYCDAPEILRDLKCVFLKEKNTYRALKVLHASVFKDFVLMTLEGVADMDAAIALKNKTVYAAREDLPIEEGAHFIVDLIGLPVIDADSGKTYGTLADVSNLGASDIYSVSTEKGIRMIPAVDEFIDRVDIDNGIFVRPIEGMFD